jgi:hypothetical protein
VLSVVLFTGAFAVLRDGSLGGPVVASADSDALTSFETGMLDRIDGSTALTYDEAIEDISISHLAFRSAGSSGANETAIWIKEKFDGFGIEAWTEPFKFTTWDLLNRPELIINVTAITRPRMIGQRSDRSSRNTSAGLRQTEDLRSMRCSSSLSLPLSRSSASGKDDRARITRPSSLQEP